MAAAPSPHISVIVPTFNEAENVAALVAALERVLPAQAEIIFVDDSTDDTAEVIAAEAAGCRVPVRLLRRKRPEGGLGGAVVAGIRQAAGAWIVVMDGDLQHPPELVPELVAEGERTAADLVVATRYAGNGSSAGLAGARRALVSSASTLLAKSVFQRELDGVSDPMSGFFAFRRDSVDPAALRPLGYKVLLDLIVRTRPRSIAEVPYVFAERHAGDSKSSLREGVRFLRHVALLRADDGGARQVQR